MKILKIFSLFIIIVLLFSISTFAQESYDTYTYVPLKGSLQAIHSPVAFQIHEYYNNITMKTSLSIPEDFCFSPTGEVFIVDTQANRIVILDKSFVFKSEINKFIYSGKTESLSNPNGVFVSKNGFVFVCDTENGRILKFDNNLNCVNVFNCPQSSSLNRNYIYQPMKVIVDSSDNMYVINKNELSGIMKIDKDNHFISFIGSNEAIVNPIEALKKKFMSKEQIDATMSFVPVEYKNFYFTKDEFIYAVSSSKTESTPCKRLNLLGEDTLVRNGYFSVIGDNVTKDEDKSFFSDIAVDDKGNFYVSDSNKGRIYVYNDQGYLICAFGDRSNQNGAFGFNSAIDYQDGNLYVLDKTAGAFSVYKKTNYASDIEMMQSQYESGNYSDSEKYAQVVLRKNGNFLYAYVVLGNIKLLEGDYISAMKYFKLGDFRGDKVTLMTGYNKAFTEVRRIGAQKVIVIIFITLTIIFIILGICFFLKKGKAKK